MPPGKWLVRGSQGFLHVQLLYWNKFLQALSNLSYTLVQNSFSLLCHSPILEPVGHFFCTLYGLQAL